ncbi:serine hydrolase [Streptosporangium sp. NPDC051022]|uniref:serine hydrolase n=1 Tax=Streptosporangium sp. NPDC051022 TaxID=3155752 RepID=UPI003442B94F
MGRATRRAGAAAAVLGAALTCGCSPGNVMGLSVPLTSLSPFTPETTAEGPSPRPVQDTGTSEATRPKAPPKVSAPRLTRALDRFLEPYGGRAAAAVRDLSTGRVYTYHPDLRLPTASTSKVDILMALLLKTPWRELDERGRTDAGMMIRSSDNAAADRLYERIGLEAGLAWANRRFGLKDTYAPPGRCANVYCWGITQTTAPDRIRLLETLVRDGSPLAPDERERVLRLMTQVVPRQSWGISAAACEGGRVSLKNGWLHHMANRLWVVVSAGLIREPGHEYVVAVLTEDSPSKDVGIAKVEGMAKRILAAFRGERGCASGEDQAVLSTSR